MRDFLYNSYLGFRSQLAVNPAMYRLMIDAVSLVRPDQKKLIVNNKTDLVIDGFPRSANTFFTAWVEVANPELKIARHMHERYQYEYAFKHNIPVIILIRQPRDAVASAMLRQPMLSADTALKNYCRFYEPLLDKKNKITLAEFNKATDSPNDIISEHNSIQRLNLKLLDPIQKDKVISLVNQRDRAALQGKRLNSYSVALPNKDKEIYKNKIIKIIDNHELMKTSTNLYFKMCEIYSCHAK